MWSEALGVWMHGLLASKRAFLGQFPVSLLVLHGSGRQIIAFRLGEKLSHTFPPPRHFVCLLSLPSLPISKVFPMAIGPLSGIPRQEDHSLLIDLNITGMSWHNSLGTFYPCIPITFLSNQEAVLERKKTHLLWVSNIYVSTNSMGKSYTQPSK